MACFLDGVLDGWHGKVLFVFKVKLHVSVSVRTVGFHLNQYIEIDLNKKLLSRTQKYIDNLL